MSGVVGVHGSELGEGQEQPGNVVLCAIVNEVEVLRVNGHALHDCRHSADDDESNVVAGEDFNQPEVVAKRRDELRASSLSTSSVA